MSDYKPKSIQIFLAEGKSTGLRTIKLMGWTGKGYIIPRDSFKSALNYSLKHNNVLDSQAVYFLLGEDKKDEKVIYVGETENFKERIKHHQKKKKFWNMAIAFISKDNDLNKAHVKYLESLLIQDIKDAGKIKLREGRCSNKAGVSEADEAYLQEFATNIKSSLAAVGFSFLKSPTEEENIENIYFCKGKGVKAKGTLTSEGFVIFAGSIIVSNDKETPTISPSIKEGRRKIFDQNKVKKIGLDWKLEENILANSPSMAAGIVLGRRNNGWTEWTDENGNTLDENERKT